MAKAKKDGIPGWLIGIGVAAAAILIPEYRASQKYGVPMFSDQLRMLREQDF